MFCLLWFLLCVCFLNEVGYMSMDLVCLCFGEFGLECFFVFGIKVSEDLSEICCLMMGIIFIVIVYEFVIYEGVEILELLN